MRSRPSSRSHGTGPPLQPHDRDAIRSPDAPYRTFIRYSHYCAPCHGDDGHANAALPSGVRRPTVTFDAAYFAAIDPHDLETAVWHMTDTKTPRMPHMGAALSDGEVRAVVEWLKHDDRLVRGMADHP